MPTAKELIDAANVGADLMKTLVTPGVSDEESSKVNKAMACFNYIIATVRPDDVEYYWPSPNQPGVYWLSIPHGHESLWVWNGEVWYRPRVPDVTADVSAMKHHGYLGVNP